MSVESFDLEIRSLMASREVVAQRPDALDDSPGDVAVRLRRRRDALRRHMERAEQTLVAQTETGVIVIAHPGQTEQWQLATDPNAAPDYLRAQFGVLDPSSVKLMATVPACMPGNPWT